MALNERLAPRLGLLGGASTTALKNRLMQMRQMLEEARRRIRVLEDAWRNDQKLFADEMQMQADLMQDEFADEVRKLKGSLYDYNPHRS